MSAALAFIILWAACTVFLGLSGGNFLFPISSLVVFGALTGAAIFLTRKTDAPAVPIERPKQESIVLLVYLVIYGLVLFGPLVTVMRDQITSERVEQLVMLAYKLVVHLLIPILLVRAIRGRLRKHIDTGFGRPGVLLTLLLFSVLMMAIAGLLNSIFEQLSAKGLSINAMIAWAGFAWLWMMVEVGLCEEFLFRVLVQSRLTALLASPALAIVLTSTIFALVHVPSFYLRGGEAVAQQASSLPQMIALAVGAIAPISILFGTLWYRTRSFLLIVVVHGAIDALPALDKLMRIWG